MDFEPLARKALPPAHWGYLASGVNDDYTLRMNREAMNHYQLRARRLSGVATPDLKTRSVRCRVGDADLCQRGRPPAAVSSGRRTRDGPSHREQKTMQMLSTVSTTSVEEVARERGSAALVSTLHAELVGRN